MNFIVLTKSKNETVELGCKLAHVLAIGDIVTLTGDLGAGKTTLVNGVACGLNIHETIVSPTFNILKCYFNGKIPLYHIDAYRLEDNKDIGLEEYIEGNGVAFIEWPIYIKELLKVPHLEIIISNKGDNNREIVLNAPNDYYIKKLQSIL